MLERKLIVVNEGQSLSQFFKDVPQKVKDWVFYPYVSNEEPIIICGCGRSGTSLLRTRLNNHQNLVSGPETMFYIPHLPGEEYILNRELVPKWVTEMIVLYDLDPVKVQVAWAAANCQADFTDVFFKLVCQKEGKKRWVEKTPKNVYSIEWILERWPKAKIIHLLRDGRDVVCSLRHHPKWTIKNGVRVPTNKNDPIEKCIKRWIQDVSAGLTWRGHKNYYELQYEQLVQNPQETLKALMKVINEPWDQDMLREARDFDFLKDPQADGVDENFYHSSIGRWKTELTREEKAIVKQHANLLLMHLGYVTGLGW